MRRAIRKHWRAGADCRPVKAGRRLRLDRLLLVVAGVVVVLLYRYWQGSHGSELAQAAEAAPEPTVRMLSSTSEPPPVVEPAAVSTATLKERPARQPTALDSLQKAVAAMRLAPSDAAAVSAQEHMPLMDMNVEQYRGWTKLAAALAKRDYTAVEQLLPSMEQLFDAQIAALMAQAMADDYRDYLQEVIRVRCEGFDPDSVWRKTLYMQFTLPRLSRSSPQIEQQAADARRLCGYEA